MNRSVAIARFVLFSLCAVDTALASPPPANTEVPHLAFTNGRWFDGSGFTRATFYAVDGLLTDKRPERVDDTFDLAGRYMVPPFGEAQTTTSTLTPARRIFVAI